MVYGYNDSTLIKMRGGMDLYRLLIVTRDASVEQMFASMDGWETRGFKRPRLRNTVEGVKECMLKHHIDARALAKDEEFAPRNTFLDLNYPVLPVFQIESTADKQFATLKEVYQLLTQLHSDHSDDDYDEAYYFRLARERWMKTLISGKASSREHVLSHHRLFRCVESTTAPCVYARLSVLSGDAFLSGRWHYGSDRLEVALRNFFGEDQERMTVHIAVISPDEVRVLACPKPQYAEKSVFGTNHVLEYIEETNDQIEQYLGLKMEIIDIHRLSNITAFARIRKSR
jgi:hypothetical protein